MAFLCHHSRLTTEIQSNFNKKRLKNLLVRDTHQFAKWLFKDSRVSKNRLIQETYKEYEYDIHVSLRDNAGRILDPNVPSNYSGAATVQVDGIFQLAEKATRDKDPQFDYLIIDEWQRMGEVGFWNVLDNVLKGGMRNGKWTIFADYSDQSPSLFTNTSGHLFLDPKEMLQPFVDEEVATVLSLELNCRNTRNIFERMQQFSARDGDYELYPHPDAPEGVEVRNSVYTSYGELRQLLEIEFSRLQEMGVGETDVVLLVAEMADGLIEHFLEATNLLDGAGYGPKAWKLSDISPSKFTNRPKDGVAVCRASQFGGLEKKVVIAVVSYVDVDQPGFQAEWYRCELFIALSRANSEVVILVDDRMRSDYKEMLGVRESSQ